MQGTRIKTRVFLVTAIDDIDDRIIESVVAEEVKLEPEQEQQLDELLGQTLMRSSQETTMKWIISMGHHLQETAGKSRYSGLCILQVIFEAITQLTGAKLGATLKALFEPLSSPATKIKFLESEYKKHSDAIAQLEAIEVQVDPVIKTFLLQQILRKLK